jgi:hypothetical protein
MRGRGVKYAEPNGEKAFWPETMKGEATENTYMCVGSWRGNVLNKLGGRVLSGFIWLEIQAVTNPVSFSNRQRL